MKKIARLPAMTAPRTMGVVGSLIALALWPLTAAGALPAATSQVECNSNNPYGDVTDPTNASLQGASATLTSLPFVQLQAQINDDAGVATQDAFAQLSYNFMVVGGNAGDTVPLLITTEMLTTSSGYPTTASATIYTDGTGPSAASMSLLVGDSSTSPLQASFSGALSLTSQSGQLRQLTLHATVEEAYLYGGVGLATVDPYISVDPSWPNASDYSIVVSPGVANVAVPEPSAWAAILLGGAALLLRQRRHRLIA